jgi:hypothetical protein
MQGLYVLTFEDLAVFRLSQVLIIGAVVQLKAKFNLLKGMSREQFVRKKTGQELQVGPIIFIHSDLHLKTCLKHAK